jgi:ketosteroid isomerase-like protein
MSQENVEVVRRVYSSWPDPDLAASAGLVHPDVVIDLSRNVFNPGIHRGLDGFRRFLEQVDEMWQNFRITPEEFLDAGDNVFVAYRISGKGRGSGIETEMRLFGVWTLREGRVLETAGLSE